MIEKGVVALRVFVPAKDYKAATAFYEDLGFSVVWESHEVKELQIDGFSFFLQNYYQEDFANNLMFNLMVEDLDSWWQYIVDQDLVNKYPGVKAKAPEDYAWGLREVHLIDPSGVLWHIAQGDTSARGL